MRDRLKFEKNDVIILGTGLKECIVSGLLSVNGKKVLHMDRNDYYGAESTSMNLEALFKKFKGEGVTPPESLGRSRDYNVDLCPKFIMACGNLVKMLLHTKVTRYLDFKVINGSYVYKDAKIHKVPCTTAEALSSSLMGIFQKRRYKGFLSWTMAFEMDKPETHQGFAIGRVTMREIFKYFKLDENTIAFTGHSLALYLDDSYEDDPREVVPFIERCKLYAYSVSRYGSSPYIYPLWGLGGLPEGFSRLSAVHGGTYMLNRSVDEIMYDDEGRVCGVKSQGEVARCKQLVADPSYFAETDRITKRGKVARWLFILSHPIPNTGNGDSCQIIVPARQMRGRKSDIYIAMVGWAHNVAAKTKYIAMISANVETNDPKRELQSVVPLLGGFDDEFFFVSDTFLPTDSARDAKDGVFISSTYDPTSHFETTTEAVLETYERMTGQKIDLSISADPEDVQSLE
eukprot:89317_1